MFGGNSQNHAHYWARCNSGMYYGWWYLNDDIADSKYTTIPNSSQGIMLASHPKHEGLGTEDVGSASVTLGSLGLHPLGHRMLVKIWEMRTVPFH